MKKVFIVILVILIFIPSYGYCEQTDEFTATVEEVIDKTDISMLMEYYTQFVDNENSDIVSKLSTGDFSDLSPGEILALFSPKIITGIKASAQIMLQIILIMLIFMLMQQISGSFGEGGAAKTALYVGYVVICGILLSVVINLYGNAQDTINSVSSFFSYVSPVLVTLLTTLGGYASSTVISPVIAAFTGGVIVFIQNVLMPMLMIDIAITVTGGITKNINLTGISKLIKSIVKWTVGIIFIVFLGIVTVQSFGSGAFDGLSIRTAKYTIDKAVPLVGGMFSDSLDTLVACGAIVKNAIGITGLIIIAAILIVPVINMIANIIMTKICGAVSNVFVSNEVSNVFEGIGENIKILLILMLTVGIMAFVLIGIIVWMGNLNIMMR